MGILLTNALLTDLDPPRVEAGALRLEDGRIVGRGASAARQAGDEVADCGGAVVLPGLVNGHTHLYSALAVGMPPPPAVPRDFADILRLVWWRLDRALDAGSIELSAAIGGLAALRCGTTTLIDHHASPNCIAGSLDAVERGLCRSGVRGVLAYETTDRHGIDGRVAGLAENRRYLELCRQRPGGRFAGLVGAHASFTLDDEALAQLAGLAAAFESGVHIHVAEDPIDAANARERGAAGLAARLAAHGLMGPRDVFAHGTHLTPAEIKTAGDAGVTLAHNPRSNMNNAVGYAPVASYGGPAMLGTDGIGADMLAEARAAWLIGRHQRGGLTPAAVVALLAAAARRASAALGITLGRLEPGAAADLVITDYVPFTPLTSDNLPGHLLFGLDARHVRHVVVAGEWRLRERNLVGGDEAALVHDVRSRAAALWQRMALLPP